VEDEKPIGIPLVGATEKGKAQRRTSRATRPAAECCVKGKIVVKPYNHANSK